MAGLKPAARLYIVAIVLGALTATAVAATRLTAVGFSDVALGGLVALLTALSFRYPLSFDVNTRLHLDTAVIFAAILILEPGIALPAVALGTLSVNAFAVHEWDRAGWVQAGFNAAQTALQAGAGVLALTAFGWSPAAPDFERPHLVAGMLGAGAAMYLVNTLAVATIIALQADESPARVWLRSSATMDRGVALAHLAQLGLGLLAAILVADRPWALSLVLLPAVAVYGGLQGHVRLRRGADRRLARAQRIAHLGSWEWELTGDRHEWSDETFRILGHEPEAIVPSQRGLLEAVHPDDRTYVREALVGIAEGVEHDLELRVLRPDGTIRVVHLIGEVELSRSGRPKRVLGTLHDITERKQLEEALAHRAYHDPLTDLPNRASFAERLEQALARADRRGRGLAVLYLDLDGFKAINDSLGHDGGDELLIAVSQRLRGCLRMEETLARRGGDEFTILLEDLVAAREGEQVAARLIAELGRPFALRAGSATVGASVGLAFRGPGTSLAGIAADALLRAADEALYAAKATGKGRYVVAPLVEVAPSAPDLTHSPAELALAGAG